jgi:hypothetical protein
MRRRVSRVRTDDWRNVSPPFLLSVLRLLVTAKVHSSPILVTLMMGALLSSETSVVTGATPRNSPEDGILQSHRHKSLIAHSLYCVRTVVSVASAFVRDVVSVASAFVRTVSTVCEFT